MNFEKWFSLTNLSAKVCLGFVLIALAACTSSTGEKSKAPEMAEAEYEMDISKAIIGDLSVMPEVIPALSTTATSKESTIILRLKNNGSSAVALSGIAISEPKNGFTIKTNRCSSSLASGATCQVTIAFSNRGLYDGTYNASLEINESPLQLSGTVSGLPDPNTSGSPELELTLSSAFSPLGAIPYRTLTIKNVGTGVAKDLSVSLSADYSVRIDRCSSTLAPKKSCEKQIMLLKHRTISPPSVSIGVSAKSPANVSVSKAVNSTTGIITNDDEEPTQTSVEKILYTTYNEDYSMSQLFISVDNGLTSSPYQKPVPGVIQNFWSKGNTILVRDENSAVISSDNGLNFSPFVIPETHFSGVAAVEGSKVVVGTQPEDYSTVNYFFSPDLGQTFLPIIFPSEIFPVANLTIHDGNIYAFKSDSSLSYAYSNNNGGSFELRTLNIDPSFINISTVKIVGSRMLVFAYNEDYSASKTFLSLNSGQTFTEMDFLSKIPGLSLSSISLLGLTQSRIYVSGFPSGLLFVSTNDGQTFSQAHQPSGPDIFNIFMEIFP